MKMETESVGAWLFRHIEKPEWAEKKLRYWALAAFAAGIWLTLGPGLGIPGKLKTEPPFIEWEQSKSGEAIPPVNIRALWVGGGLIVFGLLFSVPILPLRDKEIDKHYPAANGDQDPDTPILFLDGPLSPDRDQIVRMLTKFRKQWPSATVRWPKSTERILKEASAFMTAGHRLDGKSEEIIRIFKRIQLQLPESENLLEKFARNIPGMITRSANIPDKGLVQVIANYLIVANYRAINELYQLLSEAKKSFPNLELPGAWNILATRNAAWLAIYGASHPSELRIGILVAVGDHPVYADYGGGVSVTGRKGFIYHRTSIEFGSGQALIAELESEVAERGGTLPNIYAGDMFFSKIGPVGTWNPLDDSEVSSDPELLARGEAYSERWKLEHGLKTA